MKTASLCLGLAALAGLSIATAQMPADPPERGFSIIKHDKALDAVIAPNAKLELVSDGFGLTEGPVWVPQGKSGYLLFSDLTANVIYKWEEKSGVSVYLDKAGYSGEDINNAGTQTRRAGILPGASVFGL